MLGVVGRNAARIAVAAVLVLVARGPAVAAEDLTALNQQMVELHGKGLYQEAAAIGEKALALAERTLGPDHGDTLTLVNNLGLLYQQQGRYAEAEPLSKRAVASRERISGADHPDTLSAASNLAVLYDIQGRDAEAEPLYRRVLAGFERIHGPDHPDTLRSVNNLAFLLGEQGRHGEAETLYRRALAAHERLSGPDDRETLAVVGNLGMLYEGQGRYAEAEPLLKRALSGHERALGPDHPDTLRSLNNLGLLHSQQGREGEAEPLYRRALAGYERTLGRDHPETLVGVNNLALLYRSQGRYAEAEPLLKRSLAGAERAFGADHPETLQRVNNLALLYQDLERFAEAEPLHKRALAGMERAHGQDHPGTLLSLNNLAGLYVDQNRYAEAEPLYLRALAAREKVLGPDHRETLDTARDLAMLYLWQVRRDEAERYLKRALAGYDRLLGPMHPRTLTSINDLAGIYFDQSKWPDAVDLWRRSTAVAIARTVRGTEAPLRRLSGKKLSETERLSPEFRRLIKAAFRLAPKGRAPDAALSREMFQAAQWVTSPEAARSLTQMAARGASGNAALAKLVRERQDLVADWQRRELARNAALGQETGKRDGRAEAENDRQMAEIDRRITAIDKTLAEAFPDYATLASPAALTVEEVQAQLAADEALVLFLDMPARFPTAEETFIWVVTKTDMRWIGTGLLGTTSITRDVQTLRCGLDHTAWKGPRCKELTGVDYSQADHLAARPLPFKHDRAYWLYKHLFGKVEDLIKGKHLLLVPSGSLTQLPFQVLVTETSTRGDNRATKWLVRRHALTVLPAVSSLRALRTSGHPSAATRPLIGFGNPLLDGPDARYARLAKLARDKQSCPRTPWQRIAGLFEAEGGVAIPDTRGAPANVSLLRKQTPLPETADELCAVARDLGADAAEIRLGAKATEREVKAMSARGELAGYRVVHFATHGAMAGELQASSEPGLILTPPATASQEDDGYLSASEIATLKLDADWVILSACNTAAGEAANAEALSGLARAFIYAQARALLVSHWEVDSDAAVRLVTSAMREIARDKTAGRAEGLRRAMLALIDTGEPAQSHPAFWAPFVVVGDGGR